MLGWPPTKISARERGQMKSTPKILMLMILTMAAVCFTSHPAAAQRGSQRITCSSNNGNRNWCDIGGNSDVRLVRQISGSACIRNSTWGVDRRGLWVDRGCRAEFQIGGGGRGSGPPTRTITCSSNNGNRNWCDIGGSRDVQISRQISGSACIRNNTWGVDRRGLWVDRGCRAEFRVR